MSNDEIRLPVAFGLTIELGYELGVRDISKLDGCHELAIDDHWWIAVNGHKEPTRCSRGPMVDPFAIYVEFNGFPAGILDSGGGCIAAGESANHDSYVQAVTAAVERARASGGPEVAA